MAELAAGAVTSLLGVIRNEAQLLGRVGSDVQFIKEEMESMNSFLAHLARTSPPGGEHDEQVRTWMTQVRVLAHDCNNCLDLYLYRGNRDIHRAKGGAWSCLWWAPWFLQKMVAQHQAATQLRELKDRARDVGERRLRYGVEVPAKAKAKAAALAAEQHPSSSSSLPGHPTSSHPAADGGASAAGDHHHAHDGADDDDDDEDEEDDPDAHAARRRAAGLLLVDEPRPRALEDYFQEKLLQWMGAISSRRSSSSTEMPSMAVVAPAGTADAGAIAQEASAVADQYFGRNHHVLVLDITEAREFYGLPIFHWEIPCYILWLLKPQKDKEGTSAWMERSDIASKIRRKITEVGIRVKIEKIKAKIGEVMAEVKKETESLTVEQLEPLGVLDQALQQLLMDKPPDIQKQHVAATTGVDTTTGGEHNNPPPPGTTEEPTLPSPGETSEQHNKLSEEAKNALKGHNIEGTAVKLKEFMEKDNKGEGAISLGLPLYKTMLEEVFPAPKHNQGKQQEGSAVTPGARTGTGTGTGTGTTPKIPTDSKNTTTAPTSRNASAGDENQIKEIVHKFTREIIHDLLEDTVKKLAGDQPTAHQHQTSDAGEEAQEKIQRIRWMIEDQMLPKGIADRIDKELNRRDTMIIIKDDSNWLPDWKKTSNDLSMLSSSVKGAVIVTTTMKAQQAKEYFSQQQGDPISYSPASLYHEWVLKHTKQPENEDQDKRSQVLRGILDKCEPHEFCMKIFAHALYANTKRSTDELRKLENTLVPEKTLGANAKKMFKFSYNNLPKEYKSCLLYLAIFPKGHTIRRSTLVGRWVAEGLIAKEDWPTSVRRAERCFDSLVDRWLVHPVHFSAAVKVKSCMVCDPVHAFITKIAKKQHIVETRLSHHLARHFSVFNDVRLRGSDKITKFLDDLCVSSWFHHLKVLDLEGCHCFANNLHYLQEICRKISLLKYLGLRDTDITQLPMEINKLHELEVLDIRETKVLPTATKRVIFLKLRRLLYSCPIPGSTDDATKCSSSVRIPHKIGKMVHMETLSSVQASESGAELRDIGQLSQLRKLGVVIKGTDAHLSNLLEAISDLHECLRSLSITVDIAAATGEPPSSDAELPLPKHIEDKLVDQPKALESLTIVNGQAKILKLLLRGGDNNKRLTKITLSNTLLNQDGLDVLAALPMLLCVRLRDKACMGSSSITLKKNGFQKLNYFIVQGSNMNGIKFEAGAVPELKKMVLSSYYINELSGVENLPELEELELSNSSKLLSSFAKAERVAARVALRDHVLEESLEILEKKTNIHCLVLLGSSCDKTDLTFQKDSFPDLNLVAVDCPRITCIRFSNGSAPKLKKIIWTITDVNSMFSGIENLPKLKEIEIKGDVVPDEVEQAIRSHKNGIIFTHNKPEKKQQNMGDKEKDGPARRAPAPLRLWKHWR